MIMLEGTWPMSEADGTIEQVWALYKLQQDDFPHYALNRWMITPPQNNLVGYSLRGLSLSGCD